MEEEEGVDVEMDYEERSLLIPEEVCCKQFWGDGEGR